MDYWMQYFLGSSINDADIIEEEPPERWKWDIPNYENEEEIF